MKEAFIIRYIKKIAFLIFLILFCAFNLSAQTKLTQEEYNVYASVLRVIYKENRQTYSNKSEFVFVNKTKFAPELLPSGRKYGNLVKDFIRKNSISGTIEKRFPRRAYSETYYLVSQAEVNELLEEGRIEAEKSRAERNLNNPNVRYTETGAETWMIFYQKYPESSGVHTFSRVGFSGQFAMVQVKGERSWNGFTRNYILRKVKGRWKIITSSGSEWVS